MHQKVLHPFCRHMHDHYFIFLLFLSIDGIQLGTRARCSLGDLLCPGPKVQPFRKFYDPPWMCLQGHC